MTTTMRFSSFSPKLSKLSTRALEWDSLILQPCSSKTRRNNRQSRRSASNRLRPINRMLSSRIRSLPSRSRNRLPSPRSCVAATYASPLPPTRMTTSIPHRAVFGTTQYWMGFYMNNTIRWRNKAQAVMEADICSLPETPDEETYLFRVDQGARFWDQFPTEGGRRVTSEDIRVNFQRHIDGRDATGAEDGTFPHRDSFAKTASMDTPDDLTFIARTDGPDATWLGVPLGPFGWITSPEAIAAFGDRWRDDPTNIELSSGTGMTIPRSYDPDIGIELERNPGFWKLGVDGLPLPYFEQVTFASMQDPTAIETAYRGREISIGGFPLTSIQVESISSDFPDHPTGSVPFGYPIITGWFNFNRDWPGWDGLGNPYLDRRFCQALHVAVDRYLMIDTVYLGSAKPTGQEDTPWYNSYWAIPEEELLTVPGFRPDEKPISRKLEHCSTHPATTSSVLSNSLPPSSGRSHIRASSKPSAPCTPRHWASRCSSRWSRSRSSCSD